MAQLILLSIPHDWGYGRAILRSLYSWAKPRRDWAFNNSKHRAERLHDDYRAVIALAEGPRFKAYADAHGIPFCDLSGSLGGVARIVIDPEAIASMALVQAQRRGYRRLAACDLHCGPHAEGRVAAFVAAAERADLACSVFRYDEQAERRPRGQSQYWRYLHEWLHGLAKPAFVFCASDESGSLICESCRRNGIRVPEDVSVLGVDNDDLYAMQSFPALSSIALPTSRIGELLGQWIDRVLAGGETGLAYALQPIRVVSRRSSEALAVDDALLRRAMALIDERAADGLEVVGLLRSLGVGRRHLETLFRTGLGSSPHAEIRWRRVERARELLDQSDLCLDAVAAASGFGSAARLSVVFKQFTGTTPGAWRRSISAAGRF